ncbi:MAG: hypothetical protein U0R26_10015 [Solirubrobacterales bacterium]
MREACLLRLRMEGLLVLVRRVPARPGLEIEDDALRRAGERVRGLVLVGEGDEDSSAPPSGISSSASMAYERP